MRGETVLGISVHWFFMITIFWCILAILLFGVKSLEDGGICLIIVFLTIGTALLIGHYGWQILILPSLAIIGGAAVFAWHVFTDSS